MMGSAFKVLRRLPQLSENRHCLMMEPNKLNLEARERYLKSERHWIRRFFISWIRPRIRDPLNQQRAKLVCWIWGYWPLFFMRKFRLMKRLKVLAQFLRVDWNVLHSHHPSEIVPVARALSERQAHPGEVMVEAGCWKGGSSVKFSILCALFGYRLCIYDSFQGVERPNSLDSIKEWDFGEQYASPKDVLENHLRKYGVPDICSVHEGWFSETLAQRSIIHPVRIVFIDCDLAKGTKEVLRGTVPSLVEDAYIFSQDYHIEPVRHVLYDPATWDSLGKQPPTITPIGVRLAILRFQSLGSNPI